MPKELDIHKVSEIRMQKVANGYTLTINGSNEQGWLLSRTMIAADLEVVKGMLQEFFGKE